MRDFEELAEMAEAADGGSRRLDGLIFRALEQREGDVWVEFGDDDVWHRQDPDDRVAYDTPPRYTGSIDVAAKAAPEGWRATVRQRSTIWRAELSVPDAGKRVDASGTTEAGARIAAALRAVAMERGKTT
jgi:hypothetical protein